MKFQASILTAGATLALLTACGGDSGGDGTPVSANAVAITSTNENAVARATAISAFTVGATSSLGTSDSAQAHGRATAQSAARGTPLASGSTVDRLVRRALGVAAVAPRRHAAAASTSSDACTVGGSLTTTFDDRDNNGTASVGDVITVTFNQCRDTSDSLVNGTIGLTVTSVSSQTQFAGTAVFNGIVSTQGSLQATLDGTVSLAETDSGSTSTDVLTIGSGGLAIGITSPSYTDRITYASGMTITTVEDDTLAQTALSMNGSFASTALGGQVTLATVVPVVLPDDGEFPTSGQVRVTGAAGSVLLITAINATQAELKLDANGDGSVDSTVDVDWTTLVPQ